MGSCAHERVNDWMHWLLLVIHAKLILNMPMKSSGNEPSAFCAFLVLLFGVVRAFADTQSDWPRWRGPQDNGSTEIGSYPIRWDTNKVLWKVALPGKGCSTPAIWNDHIYLTAP